MPGPIWRLKHPETDFYSESSSGERVGPVPGMPSLISKILAVRNINRENLEQILYPKLGSLKDPMTLLGMRKAVERLVQAYRDNEKICIYADFDLDGTSGLALLATGLRSIGFNNLVLHQPKRLSEGYGFHAKSVEELKAQGVSLIVTVDVGITALAACEKAKGLGVDVIITDHHLPGEILPNAYVIVNPNQKDCGSGLGYLCGAGVAYYLLRAVKRSFFDAEDLPKNKFDLKDVLDFFTIATLTDMVPLVEDNRVLVKHGLLKLAETDKVGLRALLEALGLTGRPLTSQDVAIRFAPKLNALSRMEAGILPIDIMLLTDQAEADRLVHEVLEQNSNRVQLQNEAEQEALELLKNWTESDFVFVASPHFHRGVLGLIATKLAQSFNKPCFVGSVGSDGMVVGSSRLPPSHESCLVEALTFAGEHLSRFGGHSAAAGFELFLEQKDEFIKKLSRHYQELKQSPRPLELQYDCEARLGEIDASTMKWYDFVGPFGAGFEVPLIRFEDISLENLRELKGGHYRLKLRDRQGGGTTEALLFSPTPQQLDRLQAIRHELEILGELQWNYYNGQKSIQILVRDLRGV